MMPSTSSAVLPTVLAASDAGIGEALSDLTGSLQVPVLVAAIAMLLLTTVETGRLLTELLRRALHRQRPLRGLAAEALADPAHAPELAGHAPSAPSAAAVRAFATDPGGTEHALADYEHAVQRRIDRTRLLVRAGPAFGLMGTLIPLAPGLTALGTENVLPLADALRTAFAATVIGILTGTVAFALTLTRSRLYSEDLTALERAAADHAGDEPTVREPAPDAPRPTPAAPVVGA